MIRLLRSRGSAGWHTHLHGLATQNHETSGLERWAVHNGLLPKDDLLVRGSNRGGDAAPTGKMPKEYLWERLFHPEPVLSKGSLDLHHK
jgi:hypothetical protein